MARLKKAIKKAVSVSKSIASMLPMGRTASAVSSLGSLTSKKKKGRRKQSIASIKRKIALIKAKKELSKVRGY